MLHQRIHVRASYIDVLGGQDNSACVMIYADNHVLQVLHLRGEGLPVCEMTSATLQDRQGRILALAEHLGDLRLSSEADVTALMNEALHISQL